MGMVICLSWKKISGRCQESRIIARSQIARDGNSSALPGSP